MFNFSSLPGPKDLGSFSVSSVDFDKVGSNLRLMMIFFLVPYMNACMCVRISIVI